MLMGNLSSICTHEIRGVAFHALAANKIVVKSGCGSRKSVAEE